MSSMSTTENVSYFILKCVSLESLQKCIETEEWACQDRVNPPHPRKLLTSAQQKGRVILIFSVNNQHGWHGFCESHLEVNKPLTSLCETETHYEDVLKFSSQDYKQKTDTHDKTLVNTECHNDKNVLDKDTDILDRAAGSSKTISNPWHYFPVKWLRHFQTFSKQACLGFDKTQHLSLPDGCPVNKARNWQQVTAEVGEEMCLLIEEHHQELSLAKQRRDEELLASRAESYFKAEEDSVVTEISKGWAPVIDKVEKELGKVHLVCPFGSQRYNCSVPGSDNDIFIVYQARTTQILGLDPPKQTIKNSDREVVDYTVLELQRYCELLVAGDHRCVETLFLLGTGAVSVASSEWKELCEIRKCFLTKTCFDKYMKEAQGTTGLKQLQKWRDSNLESEQMPLKQNKLGYIILRLLQGARDMAVSHTLNVFRESKSVEREELLAARQGSYTYSGLMAVIERYFTEIQSHRDNIQPDNEDTKVKVQNWLLDCRIQDLHQHPHVTLQ